MSLNGVSKVGQGSGPEKSNDNITATLLKRSSDAGVKGESVTINKKEFSELSKRMGVSKETLTDILSNNMGVIRSDIESLKSKNPRDLTIPTHKREAFNNFLEFGETHVVEKMTTPQNLAFQALGKDNILSLKSKGETFERHMSMSLDVDANIGLSGVGDDEIKDLILGATDTQIGASAKAGVSISSTVRAEKDGEKVILNFDIDTTVTGSFSADLKVGGQSIQDVLPGNSGDGFGGVRTGAITYKKTFQLEFKSQEDAISFIENKGKGFSKVSSLSDSTSVGKGYKEIKKTDILTESSSVKTYNKIVKKSTHSMIGLSSSISKQRLEKSSKIGSLTEEHSVSLDTSSSFVVGEKAKSSTSLTIINNKEKKEISGDLKIEINLDKIRNSKDIDIAVNKYFDRLNTVVSKSNKEGVYNISPSEQKKIKDHVEDMILDLFWSSQITGLKHEGVTNRNLNRYVEETSISVGGSAPVAPGVSVTLGVDAKWGKKFTFSVPLKHENKGDTTSIPKLALDLEDSSKLVFLKDSKALSLTGGVSAGYSVLSVGASVTIGGGQERTRAIHKVT